MNELLSISIRHWLSGLDTEVLTISSACGTVTAISGYTEWVSSGAPALSIGWDWSIPAMACVPYWRRVGTPRSNIMLVYETGADTGWDRNLELLATVVDALPWREHTSQAVALRYA